MGTQLNMLWIALLVVATVACGKKKTGAPDRTEQDHPPATSQAADKISGAESPLPPAPKTPPALTPLPVPEAYFGDIGLPRLKQPVTVTPHQGPRRQNSVLLVVIDALNAKHTSLYGYERPTTPHLTKLGRQGLVLTNYISNSSWTRPSYTTIITGLSKRDHQVELSGKNLDSRIVTLAERFRKAGYATAGIVGNPLVRSIWGFAQGFQHYVDTHTLKKAFPPDRVLVDRAIDWLEKTDKPFFLLVFLTSPHVPYRPPRIHRNYLNELPRGPVIEYPFKEYEKPLAPLDHQRIIAAYDGDVAYGDQQLGRLIQYLEEHGKMDSTTLLVTADHGEVFGHHNCYVHAYHTWEPALRVPFVLVSPALPTKGYYSDLPFTHIDIAPTLLHLSGLEIDSALPGHSVAATLEKQGGDPERLIFSQYNAHGIKRQILRKGKLKLVHHNKVDLKAVKKIDRLHTKIPQPDPMKLPTLAYHRERYELYDLVADPGEEHNIYSDSADRIDVKNLKEGIDAFMSTGEAAPQLSEETLKALKAAGYIAGD